VPAPRLASGGASDSTSRWPIPARASGPLLAAGVRVDRSSLLAENTPPASLADDATVTVNYDQARLAEVRQRQDFAMERVCATGAVIEACPTSNRRIAGVTEPVHPPDPPELQRCLSPTCRSARTERGRMTFSKSRQPRPTGASGCSSTRRQQASRSTVTGPAEQFRVLRRSHLVARPSVPQRSTGKSGPGAPSMAEVPGLGAPAPVRGLPAQVSGGVNVREKFGESFRAGRSYRVWSGCRGARSNVGERLQGLAFGERPSHTASGRRQRAIARGTETGRAGTSPEVLCVRPRVLRSARPSTSSRSAWSP
jgi:hypothetical protein